LKVWTIEFNNIIAQNRQQIIYFSLKTKKD